MKRPDPELTAALRAEGGNYTRAAKRLGVPRSTLVDAVKRAGLTDYATGLRAHPGAGPPVRKTTLVTIEVPATVLAQLRPMVSPETWERFVDDKPAWACIQVLVSEDLTIRKAAFIERA